MHQDRGLFDRRVRRQGSADGQSRFSSAKALAIDLDGTLIDGSRARAEAFASVDRFAVERFGTDPSAIVEHAAATLSEVWLRSPFADAFVLLGCEPIDALHAEFSGPGALLGEIRAWMPGFRVEFWHALCARGCARQPADADALSEVFIEERRARIRTFPGVADALADLRGRYSLVLLSNGPSDLQRLKLEVAGLRGFFDAVVVSAEIGFAKPSPEIFALACAAIASPVGHTVMVGDNLKNDVVGARNAGLLAVFVRNAALSRQASHSEVGDFRTPVIDRFTDLPAYLGAR